MHFGGRRCKFGRVKGNIYLGKLTDEFVVKHRLLQAIKEDSQAISNDLSWQFITLSQRIVATQTNVDALLTDVLHKQLIERNGSRDKSSLQFATEYHRYQPSGGFAVRFYSSFWNKLAESCERVIHQQMAYKWRVPEAEWKLYPGVLWRGGSHCLRAHVQHVPCIREKRAAARRKSRSCSISKKELRLQALLKLFDLFAQCRLRDIQANCSPVHIAFFSDCNEIVQMTELWALIHNPPTLLLS